MPYNKTIPIETIEPIEFDSHESDDVKRTCGWKNGGVGMLFLCLVLLFLGILLILGLIHPPPVVNPSTDKLDWGKLTLASFIFALLGTIIIWIVVSCA